MRTKKSRHIKNKTHKNKHKQIDKEKAEGLIMDPAQIAQQGQQELMNPDGAGGAATGNTPTPAPADSAPAGQDKAEATPKGDLSLNNEYTPVMRMLHRVL